MTPIEIAKWLDAPLVAVAFWLVWKMYEKKDVHEKETRAQVEALNRSHQQQVSQLHQAQVDMLRDISSQNEAELARIRHDLKNMVTGQEALLRYAFQKMNEELPDGSDPGQQQQRPRRLPAQTEPPAEDLGNATRTGGRKR